MPCEKSQGCFYLNNSNNNIDNNIDNNNNNNS